KSNSWRGHGKGSKTRNTETSLQTDRPFQKTNSTLAANSARCCCTDQRHAGNFRPDLLESDESAQGGAAGVEAQAGAWLLRRAARPRALQCLYLDQLASSVFRRCGISRASVCLRIGRSAGIRPKRQAAQALSRRPGAASQSAASAHDR